MHEKIAAILRKAPPRSAIKRLEEWFIVEKSAGRPLDAIPSAWARKAERAEDFFYELYADLIAEDTRHEGLKIVSVQFMQEFLEEYASKFNPELITQQGLACG